NSRVYEYPIWFFNHWPWVPFEGDFKTFISKFGDHLKYSLKFFKAFKYSVDIRDVLEQKQAALAEHKSQVTQLISNPQWLTLQDISQGQFLNCFFQNHELFRSSDLK
ncbi:MAG: PIG-L family deacetylase, partial [Cyanobacteriota bacterium]|nr:PIG-L family deacetylase [Cyanobacteriota bacterium]